MARIIPVKTKEEIAETSSLAKEIWIEHYTPIIGPEQVKYMLDKFQSKSAIEEQVQSGYLYYLILDGKKGAGYFALVPELDKQSLQLSKYYVHKDFRGRGLGRMAFEHILKEARKLKVKKIWLTVNKNNSDSLAVYSRLGFKNEGAIVQEIGQGFVMDDYLLSYLIYRKHITL